MSWKYSVNKYARGLGVVEAIAEDQGMVQTVEGDADSQHTVLMAKGSFHIFREQTL